MTDTREPKPGEWWDDHRGGRVLVLSKWSVSNWIVLTTAGDTRNVDSRFFARFTHHCVDLTPPTPPAKRPRAWRAGEAPIDAWYRVYEDHTFRAISFTNAGLCFPEPMGFQRWTRLLEHWQHSTDSGRTWQACGVEDQ